MMIRLPDGMRERIKAYAERNNRSMNAEIVRVLEREFPEPWPLEERLNELIEAMRVLGAGKGDQRVEHFITQLEETIEGIVSGRATGIDSETRAAVMNTWSAYQLKRGEEQLDEHQSEYDEEEARSLSLIGRPEKFAIPPTEQKQPGNLSDDELKIFQMGFEAGRSERKDRPDKDNDIPF